MPGATPHANRERREYPRWLWFAVFAGPFAWTADFGLAYGLTSRACAAGSTAWLLASSVLTLAVAAAGLVVAMRAGRAQPRRSRSDDSTRFLIAAGLVVSAGFGAAILAAALPRLIIGPCV